MIDEATIKRVAVQCGLPAPYVGQGERDALGDFVRAIEQLARNQQREEDAKYLETVCYEGRPRLEQIICSECADAIRASGKENSNERP